MTTSCNTVRSSALREHVLKAAPRVTTSSMSYSVLTNSHALLQLTALKHMNADPLLRLGSNSWCLYTYDVMHCMPTSQQ